MIDSHVFPAVEGLTVEAVETEAGRGLLMIGVPAQRTEHKPFLVHGAVVGDRVEGTFISIVRRRGEGSIVTTASQIHAQLTAGRALLQEMSTDRLRQEKDRLRLKSHAAAGRVLAVIAEAEDQSRRPPGPGGFFSAERCLDLAAAIRGDEWGITEDIVRERVECCRHALFSFGANVSNFSGDAGVATLLLQQLLRSTRATLEAYIVDKVMPSWLDLPDSPSAAFAWLVQKSLDPS